MPTGPVITVPLVGAYVAPQFDNGQAKPASGKMRQIDVDVSEQEVSRRMAGTGDLKVVNYDDGEIGPRFVYDVKRMMPKQVLDLTDIAPGEHVHLDFGNANAKNAKELRVKVFDGVKVTAGNDNRFTKVHVDTVSGDHFKARGTVQISGNPNISLNGQHQFVDAAMDSEIQVGDWVRDNSALANQEPTVWCRHLATASVKLRQMGGVSWKEERQNNFSVEGAPKIFVSRDAWEKDAIDIHDLAAKRFTTDQAIFGQTLAERLQLLADELEGDGKIEKNLYTILTVPEELEGDHHAVHIVLQAKKQGDNVEYKLKLFDPNKTMAHFSFATDDLSDLHSKNLADLGVDYGNFKTIHCAVVPDDWSMEANETRDEFSTERIDYMRAADGGLDARITDISENEHMMVSQGFEKLDLDD